MYNKVRMVREEGDKALSDGTGRSEHADLDNFSLRDCVHCTRRRLFQCVTV